MSEVWVVGDCVTNDVRIFVDDSEVSTGTASIYYRVCDGGTDKWLDSDESTLTLTRTGLSMTYDSDVGWRHDLTIPTTLDGFNVDYEMEHSARGFVAAGTARVTFNDADSGGSGGLRVYID